MTNDPRARSEELAKAIIEAVGPGASGFAGSFLSAGEPEQAGIQALTEAIEHGIGVPLNLIRNALDLWGYSEMGALYDKFAAYLEAHPAAA